MGNRTITVCDGGGCTAEHDNPISRGGAVMPRTEPGWGTLHATDAARDFPYSYDLCPACIQKIAELLGLKTGEDLALERDALFRTALSEYSVPPSSTDLPSVPPNKCVTCGEPYVGETCYFCPAPPPPLTPTEDS